MLNELLGLFSVKYERREIDWRNYWPKTTELENLDISLPIHVVRNEKENPKGMTEQLLDKGIRMSINWKFNHLCQQKLEIKLGLCLQKHYYLGIKKIEWMGQNEGRLLISIIIQVKGRMSLRVIQRYSGLLLLLQSQGKVALVCFRGQGPQRELRVWGHLRSIEGCYCCPRGWRAE